MPDIPRPADWTDDDHRYVNATYQPTSRLTEKSWLLAAKAMGNYQAWLEANPAPEE